MADTCSACGSPPPADARFCPACGAALDAPPRCVCGEPLGDGARFCAACGRPTADAPEPQAERRPVTVVFADAVGSTAFAEQAGDEAAYRFVQDAVALMTSAVERHGGTITQFRGDGVMALFGAPIAHEDSAVRATTAGLELRDSLAALARSTGCSFRIGISTGPVVVGRVGDDVLMDYTAIGDTANVAARMEGAAPPGSIYLAEATWRAVRQYVECRPVGDLAVKGKAAPIAAYEAVRRRPIRTRLEAAVERGLGPFVGRAHELDLLLGHVDELASGRGRVVEVTGDAGIGKSRLLLELRRRLPEGVAWIQGHCTPSGRDTPYLPIADLLRNAFGIEEQDDAAAIAARVDAATTTWSDSARAAVPYLKYLLDVDPGDASIAEQEPRTRRAAIVDALRRSLADAARRQPRVVVIEDVHWADDASIDGLDALAEIAESGAILLLTTSRSGYASPFERRSSHSRIALDGISGDDAAEVAASVLAVDALPDEIMALIRSRAEGNPLFVEELTATLFESGLVVRDEHGLRLARPLDSIDVPGTLQEVILARIDRLAREARDALQLAAVIGREFTVRLLDRLAGLPAGLDDTLEELKAVELIRQKAWFPELAYLFKHALTHEVTYGTLLDERRRALHRLVAQAIEDVYADRIAEHVETLAHHWSVAEDWPRALHYLCQAADRAAATFSSDAAISYYGQAIAAAERSGEPARALELYQGMGDVLMGVGMLVEGAEHFARMAEAAERAGDEEALAWAHAYRGECLGYCHDWDRAEPLLLGAIDAAASAAPRLYAAVLLQGMRFVFGYHDESLELDPLVADLRSQPIDNPRTIAGLQSMGALVPRWRGDFATCLAAVGPEPPTTADLLATQGIYWERGLAQVDAGDFAGGLATLLRAYERSVLCGEMFFRARLFNTIGWAHLELGDLDGAIAWNERCVAFLVEIDVPDEEIESNARLNLAEAELAAGRLDRAATQLERVDALTRDRPIRGTWMLWRYQQRNLLDQSRLLLARGGAAKPDGRIDDAVALAEASGSRKYLAKAARLRGEWAIAAGQLDEAGDHLAGALAVARTIAHPPEQWRALEALARVADGAGDAELAGRHRAAADTLLADAAGGLDDAGALAGIARLRAALRGPSV